MLFFRQSLLFLLALSAVTGTLRAGAAADERTFAKWIIGGEAYGQGIWYSVRASHRFHANGMVSVGHSFIEIPPIDSNGKTVSFHIVPVSLSALWQLPFTSWPIHLEGLFGGNFVIGPDRTERTGVRATVTGQSFTPVIGGGLAFLPLTGGLTVRFTCYVFQGIDSVGVETRRLPWLGGSIAYAF